MVCRPCAAGYTWQGAVGDEGGQVAVFGGRNQPVVCMGKRALIHSAWCLVCTACCLSVLGGVAKLRHVAVLKLAFVFFFFVFFKMAPECGFKICFATRT